MAFYHSLTCVIPDCTADLYVTFSAAVGLYENDLAGRDTPSIDEAVSSSWQVECADGHVLLLPGPTGCPCSNDQYEPGCPSYEYDHSDDYRTFRAHDAARLKTLLSQFARPTSTEA